MIPTRFNLTELKLIAYILKENIKNCYNDYDVPNDTEEHIIELKNLLNKIEIIEILTKIK